MVYENNIAWNIFVVELSIRVNGGGFEPLSQNSANPFSSFRGAAAQTLLTLFAVQYNPPSNINEAIKYYQRERAEGFRGSRPERDKPNQTRLLLCHFCSFVICRFARHPLVVAPAISRLRPALLLLYREFVVVFFLLSLPPSSLHIATLPPQIQTR